MNRNRGIHRKIGCDQKIFAASQTKSQRCCYMFPLPTASSRVTPLCLNTLSLPLLSNHSEGSARKKKKKEKKSLETRSVRKLPPTESHIKQRFCMCSEGTGKVADQCACARVCVCMFAYLFSHGVYESNIKVLLCPDAWGERNQRFRCGKTGNWIRNVVEFNLIGGEVLLQRPVGILYYTSILLILFHICELE